MGLTKMQLRAGVLVDSGGSALKAQRFIEAINVGVPWCFGLPRRRQGAR